MGINAELGKQQQLFKSTGNERFFVFDNSPQKLPEKDCWSEVCLLLNKPIETLDERVKIKQFGDGDYITMNVPPM